MSDIVVDLGCQPWATDTSIAPLIERFAPTVLYGFDPAATPPLEYEMGGANVMIERAAAWTHDGVTSFAARSGIEGTVMITSSAWGGKERPVPCFDFSSWLSRLGRKVVVKMDIEGAEVPVLEDVIAEEIDDHIRLLVVEWHDDFFDENYATRRASIEATLRCPVEIWP